MVVSIVFASLLFVIALICVPYRLVASPCAAFLGLLILGMGHTEEGYPILPLSNTTLLGWLFMAVLVTVIIFCQPAPLRHARFGLWYYLGGALTGMAIGLLGFTFLPYPGGRYVFMIVCVAAATFFSGMMFANTPAGKNVSLKSGHFFTYIMAKGFPVAITVMQLGTVLVILNL